MDRLRQIERTNDRATGQRTRYITVETETFKKTVTYADNDAYPQSGFDQVMGFFRGEHGCESSSTSVSPSPCKAWDGCGEAVIECRYSGLGHSFPAGWAADTWAFFETYQ